jgi:hypothetical protein
MEMRQKTVIVAMFCLALTAMTPLALAEDPAMDPLLGLLVEQGVITLEQAQAVQKVYDKRKAAAAKPAVEAPKVAEAAPAAAEPKKASASWTERIKILGDARLRYEDFDQDGGFYHDRRDRWQMDDIIEF